MPYYFVVHILIWCLCGIFAFDRFWETERLYVSADGVSSSVGVLFKPWLNSPNLFNRYCGSSWFIANFYWWIAPERWWCSPLALAYYFWLWLQGHHFFFSGAKLQNPHSSHAHVGFDPSVCAAGNLTQTPLEFFSSHHFTPVFVDEYRPCSQF
jgi:hypothetical protein